MRSLLITGASGFLGWHACQGLHQDWDVHGTYCAHSIALSTVTTHGLNLLDDAAVQACWDQTKPDAVLHTAAVSKVNQCQQDPVGSFEVNVTGAVSLAARCAAADIPFLFTSTDLVFDGTQPPYKETDSPSPINHYGEQKVIAETRILETHPQATICRLPLLYGTATPTARCFLQGFLQAIAAGQTLTLFTDEIRTPAAVNDVVQGLKLVLDNAVTGTIHLGGPQRINRYEFGLRMADAFQIPETAMQPCLRASVDQPAPRPADVSLNSQKAFDMGYAPRSVEATLTEIAAASL